MCTIKSKIRSDKTGNNRPRDFKALKNSPDIQHGYEQCVKSNIAKKSFDKNSPTESISNLQDTLTSAVNNCIPPKERLQSKKRVVSDATKQLIQERQNNYRNMSSEEQRESPKAI